MDTDLEKQREFDPADLETIKGHFTVRPGDTPEMVAVMAEEVRQRKSREYQEGLETWTRNRK